MALFSSASSAPTLTIGGIPRVNLLPRSVTEGRERSRLLKRWGWGLVAALLVVALTAGGAFAYLSFTAMQLVTAQARTTQLMTDLAALAPVRAQLSLVDDLELYRSEAMATDLTWTRVSDVISPALPEGALVSAVAMTVGAVPQGDDPTLEVGLTGTVTVASANPIDIVDVVRKLRGAEGVLAVDGTDLQSGASEDAPDAAAGFTYILTVALDQSLYTNAYAEEVAP
ncbi:hypothetical protein [Microbacterium telephonicum]|uniref:Tfp pilus assembly protein PilN n=1 Tax=Microbacterium telephonicum TaxID=1714841 RepID=A0A498C2D2_9MICO|nr:hypothetical protein [Microbacterium telephonicum]RLK49695.1 hypothetical protein C7474_1856 [Microbacterium telephonicum]